MGYNVAINARLEFTTIECCNCGVLFAVDADLDRNFQRTKKEFFCPNGHAQSYTESEADRLRRQLVDMERARDWQKARADTLDQKLAKEQKAHGRLKRRTNAGVCPHCHRTVRQMAAHIATQHADVLETPKVE